MGIICTGTFITSSVLPYILYIYTVLIRDRHKMLQDLSIVLSSDIYSDFNSIMLNNLPCMDTYI